MNISAHRASASNQALLVVPMPPADRSEARTTPPDTALFSREELRLIVLDIIG